MTKRPVSYTHLILLRNTTLFSVFLEDYTSIVTAESECIRKGNINFAFLCFVEREIKIIVNVLVLSLIHIWFVVSASFILSGLEDQRYGILCNFAV